MPRKTASASATPATTPTVPATPTANSTTTTNSTTTATAITVPATTNSTTTATNSTTTARSEPSMGGGTPGEDQALKNINYKNMLLTGNYGMLKPDVVTHPNIDNILENEKNSNKSDPWNKLDKSAKVVKLKEFATRYGKEQECNDTEITALYRFLLANLEQKKLLRAKDVVYDKITGTVTSIPCLIFHAGLKKFTLKRCEKRQSTLKSLAPTTNMSKKRRIGASSEDSVTSATMTTTTTTTTTADS